MSAPRVTEVAAGVYGVAVGKPIIASNVYFVRSGPSWVLIDTAWANSGEVIRATAESVFGPGTRPAAILLTHIHPDHSGSARHLGRVWGLPVFVPPGELPMTAGEYPPEYGNPLDRRVVFPLVRLLPPRMRSRMREAGDLTDVARSFDPQAGVPGLPGWECVPTPGHTPGHVAFYRRSDRVLITGDAVLTVNANSLWDMLRGTQKVSGPPRYTTWSWPAATRSIGALAALEPQVLATGHGKPLATAAAPALQTLADQLNAAARQRAISPSHAHRGVQGFFGRVDYSARARYRRPPKAYRRLQWLGFVLTTLGLSPRYVVTLEVPGRHSGLIRRTSLVQVTCGGAHHLVALAGESEWVRNVRAAGGRVVIGRRRRRAATLIEVPPPDRPPVIRAYLLRAGRRAGSRRWPARPATTSG